MGQGKKAGADLCADVEVRDEAREVALFGRLAPGAGDELAAERHAVVRLLRVLGEAH